MQRSFYLGLFFIALGVSLLGLSPARAALGGDAASITSDATAWHGVDRTTLLQYYDVHEISIDNGMRVREYSNRNGVIFAVTWSGPVIPDMQRLLGTSFAAYAAALATHTGVRRALHIATSDLVVESGGHMRAFSGRAYLPALIPAGTSAADLP